MPDIDFLLAAMRLILWLSALVCTFGGALFVTCSVGDAEAAVLAIGFLLLGQVADYGHQMTR